MLVGVGLEPERLCSIHLEFTSSFTSKDYLLMADKSQVGL